MRNTHHGFFICIVLMTVLPECVSGENLTTASCSEQERLALLKFKQSVTDDHGMLSSWVGGDCCRWERVGCDDVSGRVVILYLGKYVMKDYFLVDRDEDLLLEDYNIVDDSYYLVGTELNSCLKEMAYLKHLDLSGNYFQKSRIPEFIGSFKQLRYLNLSGADFSGEIPYQIGNLSNLKVLDLSTPYHDSQFHSLELTTSDMAWVSTLSKLEHLDLTGVDLRGAQNLDNLLYVTPSLSTLRLSGCGLSNADFGSPRLNSSGELANIKHLDVSQNDFSGQLPGLFLNMTSLVFLDLSKNNLSTAKSFGSLLNMIPSVSKLHLSDCGLQNVSFSPANLNISLHSKMQHLDLSFNGIEGRFPWVLANMSSLLSLDLSANKLNSTIPLMPNLLKLDISGNKFRHVDDIGTWRHCNLKELIASSNNLEGGISSLSTNVSECSQNALEILYLDRNALNCSTLESLGRLTSLRSLDLSFNELTGPIPEALGKLRSLEGLYLKSNKFTCPIPVSIGRLTSLRVILVSSNLLNGTIPTSLGQLTKLHLLDVSNNSLQGVVSEDHFANLSVLKYLDATSNDKLLFNISREWIPPFQLKVVRLGSCMIEDWFPQWLQNQRKLEVLVLSNTSIFGPLPPWLHLMPIMNVLDLSHNKLNGSLINLPFTYKVRYESEGVLILQDNLFSGLIPRGLCARPDLQVLDLSKNKLTGEIPLCLWNTSLNVLLLGSNRLSGVIPSPLVPLNTNLEFLQLSDNNLNGELPQDVGYFSSLVMLDLGENKFSGNIPNWIGEDITFLSVLRLHKNNFTGIIPYSLCKSHLLQILDLGHNNLTGSIPHCFGELVAMKIDNPFPNVFLQGNSVEIMIQVLKGVELKYTEAIQYVRNMDLSNNKLVGEVPGALMTLDALVGLNLSYNHFNGVIPKNIGNMRSLFSLDLSANELSGMIPPSIAALNFLSHLNFSHNNLSGQIPIGNQLQTLTDPSIYAYNPYLFGETLPKEYTPHENPPTTTRKKQHEKGKWRNKVWFYLDIWSGFATGFWGLIGVLEFKRQWRRNFFMFGEKIMDKIYVAVAIKVLKMKRGCNIFK